MRAPAPFIGLVAITILAACNQPGPKVTRVDSEAPDFTSEAAIAFRDGPPMSFASDVSLADRRAAINAWADEARTRAIAEFQTELVRIEAQRTTALHHESSKATSAD